jgi:predicted phosphodiesterase
LVKIVALGDTHIGSNVALASPTSVPRDRNNEFLKWIYVCWLDLCKRHNGPDFFLGLGDLADGSQRKSLGVDALVTDTDEQVQMAMELLDKIITNKTTVFGVNGSGYHGGMGQATNIDRRIIEAVGGEYKNNIFEFDVNNGKTPVKIQVAHGGSAPSINPQTYIIREINQSEKDAAKNETKGPDILIRGHQHRFYSVQDDNGIWGILNGCWQYVTPFMSTKSANITPSIGATIIEITGGPPKIYREEYKIPKYVKDSMNNYISLTDKQGKKKK